ncbi:PAS domain S-box protein [Pseudanabaena sp. PCC 6802]|uniref:PAS domain-containing sensor histidine kinase n=1 Tax=Pseudanabaena sp. PCC 6802 TaxID=118173 RepID=UPI000347FACF|nr:PAS domain S-box protein [Pseudanabaena sp. PCC 6802]
MLGKSTTGETDYLLALEDCCRDPAAFAKLKQILSNLQERQNSLAASLQERETQVRQTSSNLQAIFEAFPDLQFRLDADGTVLDYHVGSTTTLYIPPERFLGCKVQDILPPPTGAQVDAAISQVIATKSLTIVEYTLPGSEGETIFEARLLPLPDEQIIAIVRDVTERKQAEQALRLSEEKFAKVFHSSPAAITVSTFKEGRYLEVNDTFERLSGYTREEVVGHTAAKLKIWADPEDALHLREMLLQRGKVQNVEYRFRMKSGNIGVFLVSAELIDFAGEQCILATTNDISDRKHAEAQLQAALERDRLLGEIALRIRRSLNLDQILHTTVNEIRQLLQADRVIIGLADRDTVGRIVAESVDYNYPSIMGWIADESYIREMETVLKQQNAITIGSIAEIDMDSKRYQLFRQYQIQAALIVPIFLGDALFGVLVAHQCSRPRHWEQQEIDLLEKLATQVAIAIQQAQLYEQVQLLNSNLERQVQERTMELQQKVEELQELSRLKDFFLHAVSHDLRTPIMGMLLVLKNFLHPKDKPVHHTEERSSKRRRRSHSHATASNAASNGTNLATNCTVDRAPATVEIPLALLERMIQSSDRQLEMLNLLLDSHITDAQGSNLQIEPSSLHALLERAVSNLESLLAKNQTELVNLLSPNLPEVNVDPMQINRLFENLIVNAIKHNLPGLQLTINATQEGNMLRCTLQHNGQGIEECDRLFELYVKGTHTKYSAGIGLGLYLCRQIVTAHGGQIGAFSQSNQGATFWFTLPLATCC